MNFGTKSYLKSTGNHTVKHALKLEVIGSKPNPQRPHQRQQYYIAHSLSNFTYHPG
jgi:hypothetical protein